ncbi:hypothetical protein [Sphingosinicella sp. LY1275]|uniref:hypothetical protein n=1 Tax=Sphingosinicella sp. LY1275 TaxID=3095379 RepID=UPI002ADEC287|nr:hypothetical protein [Sphingosinicella sp. LY1275]MEA1014970.1 hypothetical protein [Sphingosinicella sp. LY1275]
MLLALLLLQATGSPPDIELNAHVRARSLTIEKKGDAALTLTTSPDSGENVVDVRAPKANGRKTMRNVEVTVDAKAHIADPQRSAVAAAPEGSATTPRQ